MESFCPTLPNRASVPNHEPRINWERECTVGFAAVYAQRKARQLVGRAGFTAADRPDLEQELLLALYERAARFDPHRGHWNVFVVAVMERFVVTLLRARRTKKRALDRRLTSLSTTVPGPNGKSTELSRLIEPRHAHAVSGQADRDDYQSADLRTDVAAVIDSLPSDVRYCCWFLQQDGSMTTLAQNMRCSRTTICDRIRKLGGRFASAGLAPFLRNRSAKGRAKAVGE